MHYGQFTNDDSIQIMVDAEKDRDTYRTVAAQLAKATEAAVDWIDGKDIPIGTMNTPPGATFAAFHLRREHVMSQLREAVDAARRLGLLG